jgi:cellulose synthase operon protein C
MSGKQIDLDRLKFHLQQVKAPPASVRLPGAMGRGEVEEAYHLAAAVVTTFDHEKLRPFGQSPEAGGPGIERLIANATLRYDEQNRPCWSLNHGPRKQALARLWSRERLLAVLEAAETRPRDRLQALFEAYLRGTAEPMAQQSLTDLRHTLQIVDWLSDTALAAELPSPADVQARIGWEELVQPFRYLVGGGFYGREEALDRLQKHVAATNPPRPLLIFGPGGVGKSTLLAEFLLRQSERQPPGERLPFSYVDFDQASIDAGEPLTILLVAAGQLATQFPAAAGACQEYIQEWSYRQMAEEMRSDQNILVEQKIGRVQSGGRVAGIKASKFAPRGQVRQMDWYLSEFDKLLEEAVPDERPWLLVLDTFEEVQLRSRDLVTGIGHFLHELAEWLPRARVVIAGRAGAQDLPDEADAEAYEEVDPAAGLEVVPLELAGFDEEAAVHFLRQRGIIHERVARQVYQAVTGNPLSLLLAARVVRQEKLADLDDPAALQALLRKVAEGNIQGQLYRRVLDHIANPEVRKLAHPGLTLRLITPDLIEKVLAGPCEVTIRPGGEDAQHLFNLLSREVSLVTPAGAGILRHRPDVRAVMIAALHNDRPLVVHAIHQAAVAYYEQREDAAARAEEIYHRLFVEPELSLIDGRWEPPFHETLVRELRPALNELPPRARAWLATRLGLTGVEGVNWDEAALAEWEAHVEQRVRDRIQTNDWAGALELLAERSERSVGSRLYFLETVILRQQERWQEARRCAYDGIYSLKSAGDEVRLLDLLRQAIAIDLHLGHTAQAQNALAHARELLAAQATPDETVALELDLMALKLLRAQGAEAAESVEPVRNMLLTRFVKMSEREVREHPELVRAMVLEFGAEDLQVLRCGLNLMTLGEPTAGQRSELAKVLFLWDVAVSKSVGESPGLLLREVERPQSPDLAGEWQTYVQHSNARKLNQEIDRLLERYGRLHATVAVGLDALGEATAGIRAVEVGDTGVEITGRVLANIIAGEK